MHRCQPDDLRYSPDRTTGTCTSCERRWKQHPEPGRWIRVRLDIEMDLPEWTLDQGRLVNVVTGEVLDAATTRSCTEAEQHDGPCGTCPANR